MSASSEAKDAFYSRLSLKEDGLNLYYTQDTRLDGLSELYYISDFLNPIRTLLKTGLKPERKNGVSIEETLQKFVEGAVTLEDPAVFLLDGFLYNKGIVKAKASSGFLSALTFINSHVEFGGTISPDAIELESFLLPHEKKTAMVECLRAFILIIAHESKNLYQETWGCKSRLY